MFSERLRVFGLYVRRYLFGKSFAEHAFSLKKRFVRLREGTHGEPVGGGLEPGFDAEYGTTTGGYAHFFELRSGRQVDAYATGYLSASANAVRTALELLPGADDRTFLDLGCGEGRALIIASEYRFRAIVGVELSPALCATASANAAIIAQRFPERTRISVIEADAGSFAVPSGKTVVFMYHPFQKPVMKRVLARLEDALREKGSELYVIYLNPVLGFLFDESPGFTRYFAGVLAGSNSEGEAATPTRETVVIWAGSNGGRITPLQGADAVIQVTTPGWCAAVET